MCIPTLRSVLLEVGKVSMRSTTEAVKSHPVQVHHASDVKLGEGCRGKQGASRGDNLPALVLGVFIMEAKERTLLCRSGRKVRTARM